MWWLSTFSFFLYFEMNNSKSLTFRIGALLLGLPESRNHGFTFQERYRTLELLVEWSYFTALYCKINPTTGKYFSVIFIWIVILKDFIHRKIDSVLVIIVKNTLFTFPNRPHLTNGAVLHIVSQWLQNLIRTGIGIKPSVK